MLSVVEKPPVGKHIVPDQQGVRDFLTEGNTKLTAVEMNRVLENCGYEHQRPVAEKHVAVLADIMSRGKWQPKSQIDFAVLDGRYILVNGYHRAYAQVKSGKPIMWTIALHHLSSQAELRPLYYAFDTNVRIRSPRDILSAYEFAETQSLPAGVAEALYRAVPYIASRFEMAPQKRDGLTAKAVDRRLEVATEYAKAAGRYAVCIDGVMTQRKKKLLSAAVMAVAAITFRYQSEVAWQFWAGVGGNDGLKRGDPRHTYVMDMLSRKGGAAAFHYGPAILAWNAFYEERQIHQIKIFPETFVPRIEGTPFDGKKAK